MKRHHCVSTQSELVGAALRVEATPILPMDKQPSSVKISGSLVDPAPSKSVVFKLHINSGRSKRKRRIAPSE